MTSICKVWKAGTNILVITIPKNEQIVQNIQQNDYLEVEFKKLTVQRTENNMEENKNE